MSHSKTPMLVELNQVINEREATFKCLISNMPSTPYTSIAEQESFLDMLTLMGVAQNELDFMGERESSVFYDHFYVINGNAEFGFHRGAQEISYSLNIVCETTISEALAFAVLKNSISDVVSYFDAEKLVFEVAKLIQSIKSDSEEIDAIKNGDYYKLNQPFRFFFDFALASDTWDETKTSELYLACQKSTHPLATD